jgi:RNA polymerase sigma-70 factor (ECF subfamily)
MLVLTGGPRAVPYFDLARRQGTTEGAVHVVAHRLERRCWDLVRAEIAVTVGDPSEVEDEIRALWDALGPD